MLPFSVATVQVRNTIQKTTRRRPCNSEGNGAQPDDNQRPEPATPAGHAHRKPLASSICGHAPVFQICATSVKKWPVIGNLCVVLICGFTEIGAENQNRVRLCKKKFLKC